MEIFYIISLILLGIGFMITKKSDEKLNFIKWLIIFIISLYGYNIFIGMILGLLNITSHLWLLSIINILVAVALSYKTIKNKEYQKYFITKLSLIGLIIILIFFGVMFFKDLYIHKGDITHFAVDSAIHYRAAKHYSDNLKIFINVEDKTFFNFNVMQTGAYINDGILMNVINGLTGAEHCYIYQAFETITMFLCGLAFYTCFIDKIKTKRGFFASMLLFGLYMYGYPYNSWFYGFSYLTVGVMFVTALLPVVEALYQKEIINKKLIIGLIILLAFGLIFSYCLFVPAIFAAICIYCFLKDFTQEGKTYLKIFKKTTLIITGLLLLVTAAGIGYLFIPTFFIEGQTNLVDALKLDGGIYSELYRNFLPYIPFALIYIVDFIKKFKDKKLEYSDIFSVIVVGFFALLFIGKLSGYVSKYYLFKVYFILWIAIFNVVIDVVNAHVNDKYFRLDMIALVFLFIYLYAWKSADIVKISKIYMFIILIFYTVLPKILSDIDLSKIKRLPEKIKKFKFKPICVSAVVYVTIWSVFVCGWVWIKAGHVIGEAEKHALPNFVGMYFSENCFFRKANDLNQNFNKNQVKLALYARNNLDDMDAMNTEVVTDHGYTRIWATAMLEVNTDKIKYNKFIEEQKFVFESGYKVKEALEEENNKYIVKFVPNDQAKLDKYKAEYETDIKQLIEEEQIKILYENENGFIAQILK